MTAATADVAAISDLSAALRRARATGGSWSARVTRMKACLEAWMAAAATLPKDYELEQRAALAVNVVRDERSLSAGERSELRGYVGRARIRLSCHAVRERLTSDPDHNSAFSDITFLGSQGSAEDIRFLKGIGITDPALTRIRDQMVAWSGTHRRLSDAASTYGVAAKARPTPEVDERHPAAAPKGFRKIVRAVERHMATWGTGPTTASRVAHELKLEVKAVQWALHDLSAIGRIEGSYLAVWQGYCAPCQGPGAVRWQEIVGQGRKCVNCGEWHTPTATEVYCLFHNTEEGTDREHQDR